MKPFCVLLLVSVMAAPATARYRYINRTEDCNKPHKVFKEWAENDCATNAVADFVNSHVTDDLKASGDYYCGTVKPAVRKCFQDIIHTQCPDKETELLTRADKTAVICTGNVVRKEIKEFLEEKPFKDKTDSTTCKSTLDQVPSVAVPEDEDDFDIFAKKIEKKFLDEVSDIVTKAKECDDNKAWQALVRVLFDTGITRPEPFSLQFSKLTKKQLSIWFNIS